MFLQFFTIKKIIKDMNTGISISDKENGNMELILDNTKDIFL